MASGIGAAYRNWRISTGVSGGSSRQAASTSNESPQQPRDPLRDPLRTQLQNLAWNSGRAAIRPTWRSCKAAHTLSTTSMGVSVKFERMNAAQRAGVSKLFAHELDQALGWVD